MPKISAPKPVQKNGKKQWRIDLRRFGGGRKFFDTLEAAKRHLSAAFRDQAAYGRMAFELPHETRTLYLALEERAAKLGTTIEQALDFWQKHHRPTNAKPIGQAVVECLAMKTKRNRRARYLEQFGYSLESLKESVGEKTLCSEIEHTHIDKWLSNPKWGPRTQKGKLIDAKTFFSFCLKQKWVTSNPCESVEPITYDAKRPGILTLGQVSAIFAKCRQLEPGLLPWVVLGIFCGVRPEEIRQLTWSHVVLDRLLLDIPPEIDKNRRGRFVALQPNAVAWLKLGGDLPPKNWRRRWIRVREKAGFVLDKKGGDGAIWPHDAMRHTFCSYSCPEFGAAKTAEWHGDSERTMLQHYWKRVTEAEAKAFWAIAP